jgi:rod shape-determining protein MreD
MAKSVIGYAAASLGSRIDVENTATRAVLTFGFSVLQSALLYLIERRLLGIRSFHVMWLHELLRAAINTAVAVPVYLLLDRTKRPE